jgi:hypothetical protein
VCRSTIGGETVLTHRGMLPWSILCPRQGHAVVPRLTTSPMSVQSWPHEPGVGPSRLALSGPQRLGGQNVLAQLAWVPTAIVVIAAAASLAPTFSITSKLTAPALEHLARPHGRRPRRSPRRRWARRRTSPIGGGARNSLWTRRMFPDLALLWPDLFVLTLQGSPCVIFPG